MIIKQASSSDNNTVSELALKLWPHCSLQKLKTKFTLILSSKNSVVFLCIIESKPIAFAQCQLRNDYVEGTRSSPVGYLEGIFVDKEQRHNGIARELLRHCEQWAKLKGCVEFASDCELDNVDSINFHLKSGFTEVNLIIR